jgi:hypothetical protein
VYEQDPNWQAMQAQNYRPNTTNNSTHSQT